MTMNGSISSDGGCILFRDGLPSYLLHALRGGVVMTLAILSTPVLAAPDTKDCAALSAPIAASQISLPTRGGKITEAALVANAPRPYCQVKGLINAVGPAAPAITFQVNLPIDWNGKFVQYGGGGLNGVLISGLDPLRDAPPGPTPVERGYVTAGTDAGHTVEPEMQKFALNDEALVNHAYAAYKKTHDVALILMQRFFGAKPKRAYFIGGSEGGREALIAAQRFPGDYQGIASTVPILDWTGVNLHEYQILLDHQAGGYMSPAHVRLWRETTLEACDANDGIRDGVVANYRRCNADTAFARRRCAGGAEGADCFSDAQLALIDRVRKPYRYAFPLSHGQVESPAFGIGGEDAPGNVIPLVVDAPNKRSDALGRPRYASGDIRYFIFRDAGRGGPVDPVRDGDRIRDVSALMDATNPDLSRFAAHGGKLLMKSNTADYLVPPGVVWRYYEAATRKLGQGKADKTIRLFVSPGTGHSGAGVRKDGSPVPDRFDMLSALDQWVEHGQLPAHPQLHAFDASGQITASLPFCAYPTYPRYTGKGDPRSATSYRCVPTD